MFKTIAATAAAAGVPLSAATVPADTKPALAVIESPGYISDASAERILEFWKEAIAGTALEGTKMVLLGEGLRLTLIGANGQVLNERIDTTQDA